MNRVSNKMMVPNFENRLISDSDNSSLKHFYGRVFHWKTKNISDGMVLSHNEELYGLQTESERFFCENFSACEIIRSQCIHVSKKSNTFRSTKFLKFY